jgi:hypothetical protein
MSTQSPPGGITEQDRTLSDLLESYRHLQSDPNIPSERKRRASERMKPVWAKLAKLQDPDGFINHISEHVQREFQRRHHSGELRNDTRRGKPLCRCERPRHVCEVKQGEVPSKIRTQNLQYIQKPDSRTLAREYVQEHSGDVVVREAMESFRNLRADIYGELSDILAMMMGKENLDSERGQNAPDAAGEDAPPTDVQSPASPDGGADASTASADGGQELTADVVDAALASAVERHGAEQMAQDATEGALDLMRVMDAFQNGEVSTEDLQAVADGEKSITDLELKTDGAGGGSR